MIEEIKKIMIKKIKEDGKSEGKDEDDWDIKDEIRMVENAKLLSTLGIDISKAIKILQEHNIPIILTDEDKKGILIGEETLNDKKDFVCVHKTDYIPENDRIKTGKESEVVFDTSIKIDEEEYQIQYKQERDTIHFCVNGEVTDNNGGTWSNSKYAILVPLENIDSRQIKGGLPVDLYTDGGINLDSSSWILCPKGESEKIKEQNKKINVIEYEGENVSGYANILLQYLGYDYKEGNNYGWLFDRESQDNFYNILESEGVPTSSLKMLHTDSFSGQTDNDKDSLNIDNERIKILKASNKLNSIDDVKKILGNIPIPSGGAWGHIPLGEQITPYMQEMIKYLKEKGISIPNSHEQILSSGSKIYEMVELGNKDEITTFFDNLQTKDIGEKLANLRLQTILENLIDNGGNTGGKTAKHLCNFLYFSYLSQKQETREIIYQKEGGKSVATNKNIDRIKEYLIKIMENPKKEMNIFGEGEIKDDYFSYTRLVDTLGEEKGYTFSPQGDSCSPQDLEQSYIVHANDFQSRYLPSEHRGFINLRYNDNGKTFDIGYGRSADEVKFKMDGIDLPEEKFFSFIQDSPKKGEFERIYYMLSYPNLFDAIESIFPIDEKELSKAFRAESHRLISKPLEKVKTVNAHETDQSLTLQKIGKEMFEDFRKNPEKEEKVMDLVKAEVKKQEEIKENHNLGGDYSDR